MNSQQTFYEYIMNWLDKFNVSVEVTQSELKDTLLDISNKAVKYELITSIMWLIICIAAIVISYKILANINKIKGIKSIAKCIQSIDISNNEVKLIKCSITLVIIIFAIVGIAVQIVDIAECILFPEKIVLEFVGRYL